MSANLQPLTPILAKDWLLQATKKLHDQSIDSARLDAELILASTLKKDRVFLHSHPEFQLESNITNKANAQLRQRLKHVPIAYIHHKKEFYGREFIVSDATLIPRPESEEIINSLKHLSSSNDLNLSKSLHLLDVGTGSGILGITAKLEFPALQVTLTDINEPALQVARQNSKRFNIDVQIKQGDLLENYTGKPDIIIANLPYVDSSWERSPETNFEPNTALFADNHGLSINEQIIVQASDTLIKGGYLALEADPAQHSHLTEYAKKHHFKPELKINYIIAFKKL